MVSLFFSFFGFSGIIVPEFGKKSYKEIIKSTKEKYWKFIGLLVLIFLIVMAVYIGLILIMSILSGLISVFSEGMASVFVTILLILVMLTMIYVVIHLLFSVFIFAYGQKGVIDSLGASWKLVSMNRWKTIGNVVLLSLIVWVISMIFMFPAMILSGIMIDNGNVFGAIMLYILINVIFYLLTIFLIYPVMVLFYKNLYLEIRGKK